MTVTELQYVGDLRDYIIRLRAGMLEAGYSEQDVTDFAKAMRDAGLDAALAGYLSGVLYANNSVRLQDIMRKIVALANRSTP